MKILYISSIIPSPKGAGSNIDFSILKYLTDRGDEIDSIILKSDRDINSIPDFLKNNFVQKTTNINRVINAVLLFIFPGMLVYRINLRVVIELFKIKNNNYDLIFCSFSQTAIYVFILNIIMKNVKKILLIHDILQQAFYRRYKNADNFINKLYYWIEYNKLYLFEGFFYKPFTYCIAQNGKDQALLHSINIRTKLIIPPYKQYQYIENKNDDIFYICYFGSFNRFENIDAVNYYLNTVHQKMIHAIPNYKYLIIGMDADKHFFNDKYVDVYGFQDDPSLLLNKCNASVILLRYGAGIKIKVLELLYLGIPCFCTSVASEGVLSMEGLITNDDINELSKEIINLYNNPNFNKEAVRTQFIELYNLDKNRKRIDEIFDLGKIE
jgi:hypothetical protein